MSHDAEKEPPQSAPQGPAPGSPPLNEGELLAKIDQLIKRQSFREAEGLGMDLLRRGGSVRAAFNALGEIALAENKPRDAAFHFEKALADSPTDPKALMLRAEALQRAGQIVEAISAYDAAIKAHPRLAEAHSNRGVLQARIGQLDKAIVDFKSAVRVHPEYPDAYNNLGNALLDRGLPGEAINAFRRALEFRSEFPEALNNLGLCLTRLDRPADAVPAIEAAVRVRPNFADAWNNLGNALRRLGRSNDAVAAFRKGIEIAPQNAGIWLNYATLLSEAKQTDEALKAYEHAHRLAPEAPDICVSYALALQRAGRVQEAVNLYRLTSAKNPHSAEAQFALGKAAVEHGAFDHAIPALRAALKLRPDNLDATALLGIALSERDQIDEAVECLETVLMVRPDAPRHYCELGRVQSRGGRFRHALGSFHQALWRDPDYLDAHYGAGITWMQIRRPEAAYGHFLRIAQKTGVWTPELHKCVGNALRGMGRYEEAIVQFEAALKLRPDFVDCFNDIGIAYSEVSRLDDALRFYSRAAELRPEQFDAQWNRSLTNLALGRMELGWEEYELRWRRHKNRERAEVPIWQGESLPNGAILLEAEQGLGDNIQFIRYAKDVKRRIGKVYYECPKALIPLFQNVEGIDGLFVKGDPMPPIDTHLPLLSLPRLFGVRLETIPQDPAFLFADAKLVESWRERLKPLEKEIRIGIFWQGSPHYPGDRFRSSKLSDWAPLARLPGVRLISLQKNLGKTQVREMMGRFNVYELGEDLDTTSGPFIDTAAVMKNLDLVIGVDSSLGHLAGALGVPTWIVLTYACDWRWMRDRDTSPWYPNHRLFRQSKPSDWIEVFERMARAVEEQWPRSETRRVQHMPVDLESAFAQVEKASQAGELYKALGILDEADKLSPESCEVALKRADILLRLNDVAAASILLETVVAKHPESQLARVLYARASRRDGHPQVALECLKTQVDDDADAIAELGLAELAAGAADAARSYFERALELKPNDPAIRQARAKSLLALGQWRQGFREWEVRFEAQPGLARYSDRPRWTGAPFENKTLLIYSELSVSDTIHLVRYVRFAKQRGGRVILECHPRLARLLARIPGVDQVVPWGAIPSNQFDFQVPLFSLPHIFETGDQNVPAECPYLRPEPGLVQYWREELHYLRGFSVGIHWSGDGDAPEDRGRRIPVENFGPLAKVPGVRLISLQKGPAENDIYQLSEPFANLDPAFRLDERTGPFLDTAALIQSLDLVIAADAAIALLAGALGKEVWVVLPETPHWRWFESDGKPVWFPTARTFRQAQGEAWSAVFDRVRVALEERVARSGKREQIMAPISLGELFDKITILEIKAEKITDPVKQTNVRNELALLGAIRDAKAPQHPSLLPLVAELKAINEAIWRTEDGIRGCESRNDFGPEFVAHGRAVYHTNDKRAEVKRRINDLLGSAIVEEKSYQKYQRDGASPPTKDVEGSVDTGTPEATAE